MAVKNKIKINIIFSFIYELVAFISGFIIPNLLLVKYGSQTYGLISSVEQSLTFFVITDLGIGAVVLSALYSPLAKKDSLSISKIVKLGQSFFNKMGIALIAYVFVLVFFYSNYINDYNSLYICLLITSLAINSFVNYFFGRMSIFLLQADQKIYVTMLAGSVVNILNVLVHVLLIGLDITVIEVKFISALILLLQPVVLKMYIKKYYDIKKVTFETEPISQKWNGVSHHVASVVFNNTDIIILTVFSSLKDASVYMVYNLIVRGLQRLLQSVFSSVQSHFGMLYAKDKRNILKKDFTSFETIMHMVATFIFCCSALLIVPFVEIYTKNVTDYVYKNQIFGFLISMAYLSFGCRYIYYVLVLATGKFKETQMSLWVEVIINISISIILVKKIELIGVAIGTLFAMIYQMIYMERFVSKKILKRSSKEFYEHFFVDILVIVITCFICKNFTLYRLSYLQWVIMAIKVSAVCFFVDVLLNSFFCIKLVKNNIKFEH